MRSSPYACLQSVAPSNGPDLNTPSALMDWLTLPEAVGRIQPAHQKAVERARPRQSMLTKPAGALGVLEALSIRLPHRDLRCHHGYW